MLRAPVLMGSLRRGRQRISKTLRHRFNKTDNHGRKKAKKLFLHRSTTKNGHEKRLSIDIQITERRGRQRSPECVFYKDDQDRFQRKYTLKLKTFCEYQVRIEVEPALQIVYVKLGGKKHEAVHLLNHRDKDSKSVHSFVWSTKRIKTTESKYRVIFPCLIKFKGSEEVRFELMVKFYDVNDSVYCGGVPLSSLSMDVVLGRGEDKLFEVTYN